mgnify:CR=1
MIGNVNLVILQFIGLSNEVTIGKIFNCQWKLLLLGIYHIIIN